MMLQPERGQLKLSMYANSGLLTVNVGQSRNLQSKWQPKCNAFVKVTLYPEHEASTSCKTMIVKNNNAPSFEEKFSFELLEEDLKKRILISVWHKEPKNGHNEFLGCTSFGIQHIVSNRRIVNGWYYLLTDKLGKRKHLQVPAQGDATEQYDPSLIPSINQGVNWMEPHVFVLKKEAEGSFGFEVTGYGPARVAYIHAGSVAESMGLQVQDRIVRMNGSNVSRSGEESVSRLIRGCDKQLILEIHRPRRSGQTSGDVSFVRGSDVKMREPISSAQSSNGHYEEIYEFEEPQRAHLRPQPYGHCESNALVYDSGLNQHALVQDQHQRHDALIYGSRPKRVLQSNTNVRGNSTLRNRRTFDDFDVHALSPNASEEEHSMRAIRQQGKYSKDDCDLYSRSRHHQFGGEPTTYDRRDKFSFISQWRDEVVQSFEPGTQPQTQPNTQPINRPIIQPMHQSRVAHDIGDKAYESDSLYSRRTSNRRQVQPSHTTSRTRAYESEDCRGMRWNDRSLYATNPHWVSSVSRAPSRQSAQSVHDFVSHHQGGDMYDEHGDIYAKRSDIYSRQGEAYSEHGDVYSQRRDIYSEQEDIYSRHPDSQGRPSVQDYMPMGGATAQQGQHLGPIIEEEEEMTPRKYSPDGRQDPRIRDIRMAAQMVDYSPPYMKSKKAAKKKVVEKSSRDKDVDSQEGLKMNKENQQNTKRHYQPIGEEDTKFKSKRVLQPIGEEDTGKVKSQKSKSIFGMCGGVNSKPRKPKTFSCKP